MDSETNNNIQSDQKEESLTINDYFDLYYNNRIKYDRTYHIKNMSQYDFTIIDKRLIQKIFTYIDQVIFGGKLVYNIFGHYRISHAYKLGDVRANNTIKKMISIGTYVRNITNDMPGYVLAMKNKSVIIGDIKDNKPNYSGAFYKDLQIIDKNDK